MTDGMPTTLRSAASKEEEQINGKDLSDSPASAIDVKGGEAERLATAQSERLARRLATPTASAEPEAPKTPQVVGALHVQLFDTGQVQVNMPFDNPDLVLELLRTVHVTLINYAREQGRQAGAKQAKVPFMARVFGKKPQPRA